MYECSLIASFRSAFCVFSCWASEVQCAECITHEINIGSRFEQRTNSDWSYGTVCDFKVVVDVCLLAAYALLPLPLLSIFLSLFDCFLCCSVSASTRFTVPAVSLLARARVCVLKRFFQSLRLESLTSARFECPNRPAYCSHQISIFKHLYWFYRLNLEPGRFKFLSCCDSVSFFYLIDAWHYDNKRSMFLSRRTFMEPDGQMFIT